MALPESSPLDAALTRIIGKPSSSPGTSDTALVPKSSLLSYAPEALSYFQNTIAPKITLGAMQPVTPVESPATAPVADLSVAAPTEAATPVAAVAQPAAAPMKLQDYADYMTKLKNEQIAQQDPKAKFWDSRQSSWTDWLKANGTRPGHWREGQGVSVYNMSPGNYGKAGQTTMVDPTTGTALGPYGGTSYQFGVAYRPPGTAGAAGTAPPSDMAALADWKKTHAWTQGANGQIIAK